MSDQPMWKQSLNSYPTDQLKALKFRTVADINRAIEVLWTDPRLRGLPNDSPDGMTLIVPANSVAYFRSAGMEFDVDDLLDPRDLSPERRSQLRRYRIA